MHHLIYTRTYSKGLSKVPSSEICQGICAKQSRNLVTKVLT